MLPEDGCVVAPPGVLPEAWSSAVPGDAALLVLAPGSSGGWFGGRSVVAWSPRDLAAGLSHADAAAELQHSFSAQGPPGLSAALLPYDGPATVARYTGGLVWTPQGWRVWGTLAGGDVPAARTAPAPLRSAAPLVAALSSDLSEPEFLQRVRAIHEAVLAGDVYVVNLTRRLTGRPTADPRVAFAALLDRTRADMAAYWQTPEVTIASASPERFLRLSGERVAVSPIKGTRPRAGGSADAVMVAELLASEKERAEHVMVVDLERNDLGRVCRFGTVEVDPLFDVVTTPYCHQMVSSVTGVLRDGTTIGDLLEAAFPCGSVTGAPKIAAMRIIAELEASPRGVYTGSLAVSAPGEFDSSVLIRTAEYEDGLVRWGTGGGITVDSDPDDEWLETVLKASPFLGPGGGRCATIGSAHGTATSG